MGCEIFHLIARVAHRRNSTTNILVMMYVDMASAADRVTWWYEQATPDQRKLITKNIVESFDRAKPKYNLVINYRGNELGKQLRVAMLSGNGSNVVYTPGPSYVAPVAQSLRGNRASYMTHGAVARVETKRGEELVAEVVARREALKVRIIDEIGGRDEASEGLVAKSCKLQRRMVPEGRAYALKACRHTANQTGQGAYR
jgi:hypothetical protein